MKANTTISTIDRLIVKSNNSAFIFFLNAHAHSLGRGFDVERALTAGLMPVEGVTFLGFF